MISSRRTAAAVAFAVFFGPGGSARLFAQSDSTSTSPSYTLLHGAPGEVGAPVDADGGTITAEISAGNAASGAVSAPTPAGAQRKGNLIGQLYDPIALNLTAATSPVPEETANQLDGTLSMDDDTVVDLAPAEILWSIDTGPILSIDVSGLATLGPVFQSETATAGGIHTNLAGQVSFQVTDVDNDNFGDYGGDGLEDGWQVGYFGLPPNANATPGADPDGDNQDNRFENLAGVDPTNVGSRFDIRIVPTQAATLFFSPALPDRTYTLMSRTATLPFAPQPGVIESDVSGERRLMDTQATEQAKIYRIEISKP